MTGTSRGRRPAVHATRLAAMTCAALAVLSTTLDNGRPAAAADGPQGELRLRPAAVDASTEPFTLELPTGARCEEDGTGSGPDATPGPRTAADNWRWHGFIVEAGRDLSTLRFGAYGPGQDFDATDGALTAPLYLAGQEGLWSQLPLLKPEGQINPDTLSGVQLYSDIYTLPAGDYELGVACTDGALETRQWWSVLVRIGGAGLPFLAAVGADGVVQAADPATVPASPSAGAETAASAGGADAPTLATTPTAPDAVDAAVLERPPSPAPTGVSWAPLHGAAAVPGALPGVGWAVLGAVLLRISYLLAVPMRARPPFPAALRRLVPKGSAP